MRMSRSGIALCAAYALLSAAIWICAFIFTGDAKGGFVFVQLPVVFVHAAYMKLGLLDYFRSLPDFVGWVFLFLPMFLVLYCIGWALGWFFGDPTRLW